MTTTKTQKLQEILTEATRTGNHEMAERTRRILERQSGETYAEHYNRRFRDMLAIPADELI